MPQTKRKHRFGDRRDGRKIRTLPPMQYIAVGIMHKRNDAQNLFASSVDYGNLQDYIHKKREKGLAGFGFMHVIVAAYVRMVSQKPALNRYIAGWRIFSRDEIVLSMMVKKSMKVNAQESAIKVRFNPTDTAADVYRKMEEAIEIATKDGDTNIFDSVARVINALPSVLLRWFVAFMQFLDFFGIMPKVIDEASPFHASVFISNLGSLGIPPIYHHLYNFGNTPVFITFGAKRRENVLNLDGTVTQKVMVDYTVVTDERTTDGHYLATAFKGLEKLMKNPEKLDVAPETVVEDID
ncbi:MAG: hypothetical protein E7365_02945 [Clostridiales bacterium]|nr:hypothetical protein [Clostridiales bacterium]